MYKILKYSDVVVDSVDLYALCNAKDYMLALGKSVTSVNGAIQLTVSTLYRLFGTDDAANYETLSNAVTATDIPTAGTSFAFFIKGLLQTELPTETDATTFYDFVGYV